MKDWPSSEKPRERLLRHGAKSLTDTELLAIFLRTGVRGKNVITLARELIETSGGIRALLNESMEQFTRHKGLGISKYVQVQASLEMARRYLQDSIQKGDAINNIDDTKNFVALEMVQETSEVFACLFLDNKHRLLRFQKMFYGTINLSHVYIREIVRQALLENAAAIIITHNHPSGDSEPSPADFQLTKKVDQALQLVDVRLLDHCVVGDGEIYSFKEHGDL